MELFSDRLKTLRKEKKLSQKEVALDLDISQALLSHYERGIRECGLDFLIKAASYYGVSVDYLLGRSSSKAGTLCVASNDEEWAEVMNVMQIILDTLSEYENGDVIQAAKRLFGIEISRLLNMLSSFSNSRSDYFKSDYGITSSVFASLEGVYKSELLMSLKGSDSPPDFGINRIAKKHPTTYSSVSRLIDRSERSANEYIFGKKLQTD